MFRKEVNELQGIFVNHTNHPSGRWSAEQYAAASLYGKVVDVPFPAIGSDWDEARVRALAEDSCERIALMKPAAVLVQGEFTYSFLLIDALLQRGILVVASTSERVVREELAASGEVVRRSVFRFAGFRRYGWDA